MQPHDSQSRPVVSAIHQRKPLDQQLPELGLARDLARQVAEEVRQLVAGVVALEVRRAVDVVTGADQPVAVEDHEAVDAQRAATAADLQVAGYSGLPATWRGPGSSLRYIEGRWMILVARASFPMRQLSTVGAAGHPAVITGRPRPCAAVLSLRSKQQNCSAGPMTPKARQALANCTLS